MRPHRYKDPRNRRLRIECPGRLEGLISRTGGEGTSRHYRPKCQKTIQIRRAHMWRAIPALGSQSPVSIPQLFAPQFDPRAPARRETPSTSCHCASEPRLPLIRPSATERVSLNGAPDTLTDVAFIGGVDTSVNPISGPDRLQQASGAMAGARRVLEETYAMRNELPEDGSANTAHKSTTILRCAPNWGSGQYPSCQGRSSGLGEPYWAVCGNASF